jgi:hypothetical protein
VELRRAVSGEREACVHACEEPVMMTIAAATDALPTRKAASRDEQQRRSAEREAWEGVERRGKVWKGVRRREERREKRNGKCCEVVSVCYPYAQP